MAVKKIIYNVTRGDSYSDTVFCPINLYATGNKLLFATKSAVDNVLDDSTAQIRKNFYDTDIISTTALGVTYRVLFTPADTNLLTPGKRYFAEFEVVSQSGAIVETFPQQSIAQWIWNCTGDVNRRTA